ncbi:unnamed protein product [Coregonus sp. 'balchen']|nr:unnamed protein product [Coregonus sp. 'balchen']
MGKMLGGEEVKDPEAAKKKEEEEEERQEALRQQEEERKDKHRKMESEREEKEAEEKAAMEQACEGSLTRAKKAIPAGCGDEEDEDEESILDTVLKFLPGPLQDMFKK